MALTVAARATVTVEFLVNTNWPEDCKMVDIQKDAKEEAILKLQKQMLLDGVEVQIIGEPQIRVVLVERSR
jgi:hypothetical protein